GGGGGGWGGGGGGGAWGEGGAAGGGPAGGGGGGPGCLPGGGAAGDLVARAGGGDGRTAPCRRRGRAPGNGVRTTPATARGGRSLPVAVRRARRRLAEDDLRGQSPFASDVSRGPPSRRGEGPVRSRTPLASGTAGVGRSGFRRPSRGGARSRTPPRRST